MTKQFHFLGVGGIGMSALAHLLIERGDSVSGSDLKELPHLSGIGIKVTKLLPKEGTVIYSSAIAQDNPLFIEAKNRDLPVIHRSELVKILLEGKKGLLVAGTHGKTSTSALLAWTLISAEKHLTYAVGGILQNLQKNGGYGDGEYFVLEADESDGSFLNYEGEGAIITNIEKEHLEYWKTEEKLLEGFQTFISKVKNPDLLLWCSDDPLLTQLSPPGISYGKKGNLKLIACRQNGGSSFFSAEFEGKTYLDVEFPVMGETLVLNALAVFGMALRLGLTEGEIRNAFKTFKGVKRRQEKIGEVGRIAIYDDYAHHPTEIQVLLASMKKRMGKRRLIALFQPHRYTRTRDLFTEFKGAFAKADLTIITNLYPAGEKRIPGVSGRNLALEIRGGHTLFLEKDKLLTYLPKLLIPGDVLITIGAGDITAIGPQLIKAIS
ncbi:UDP-N-acetylmuramate--L-alanine ligase [Candidatus Neptunichlamydia sp. REUL1]|uniref:UDP-N-acetylmuramate--L-alanine ligase n=1 Tax=Candidatus Neptunichlamydia sp. REUL1 TaxID=3064277 RepID=UPI002930356D|nr:UDP-N-acetylmuramate--L-alanine ligase [Candidatus Neptunochlamydia sp. REUL1]